jgi:ABC-2 type transport system permease protein
VSGVVFRAMALGFVRDRGALAMSLVLPLVVFVVFAAIFSGASGEQLRVKIVLADEARSDDTRRLARALARDPAVELAGQDLSPDAVRERVRAGTADVGVILREGGRSLRDLGGYGKAPVVIVVDPVRAVAAQLVEGLLQKAYFGALPDVALSGVAGVLQDGFVTLTPRQEDELGRELDRLRKDTLDAERTGRFEGGAIESLVERETVAGPTRARGQVAYYAGAIAVLFLLFSAVHGALSLLEERETGILDRLLAGPAGVAALVGGKLAFLVVQGTVQVTVIFVAAWLLYGVDLPGHFGPCLLVTVAASASAAGLALALTAACATRRQAQAFANVSILILSALGGSMVPRFFMPPLLQKIGWATPNTWALEAYAAVLWRGQGPAQLILPVGLLLLSGVAGTLVALRLARRHEAL